MKNPNEKPTVKERIYITLGHFGKNGEPKHLAEEFFEEDEDYYFDEDDEDVAEEGSQPEGESFLDKFTANLIIFGGLTAIIAVVAGFFLLFFKAIKWFLSE
ncbi:hypothetical protein IJ768_01390 [Candidatus Saccharibacteria bacterium]|nr:hypothetical protein [Candidatus Saccharibacteria bacterium]